LRQLKLVHVVTHPIQYFAPLYRELARRPELKFSVYFTKPDTSRGYLDSEFNQRIKWDVDLLGGYEHFFPTEKAGSGDHSKYNLTPTWSILRRIAQVQFDVLWVHGYVSANSWLAAAIARLKGKAFLLRDDQHNTNTQSFVKRNLKMAILPLLLSSAYPIYVGEANRRFFEYYRVPRDRLFPALHCVDNAFFERRYADLKPNRKVLRNSFGINDEAPVIIFAGKMVDKKKPGLLLEAFKQVRQCAKCHLLMVGDGGLLPSLKAQADTNKIPDVHWTGFLNQTDIPKAYAASDVLVLPSAYEETWGLVVNEAMNFRLPVVVSNKVGCAADLVRPGVNGFVFESGNADEFAGALNQLVANPELRQRYGEESARIVSAYTIETCASQIVAASLKATTQTQSRRYSRSN
jgi:glycosyltransferase involved in cell wall biosynthesis